MNKELSFKVNTLLYRYDYVLNESRSPKKLPIYPSDGYWTFTSLSILLNEIHDFETIDHGYEDKLSRRGHVIKFRFKSFNNPDYQISIKIFPESLQIEVKVSKAMLEQCFTNT